MISYGFIFKIHKIIGSGISVVKCGSYMSTLSLGVAFILQLKILRLRNNSPRNS